MPKVNQERDDEFAEMRATVARLEQELAARDEFLSIVSHELKTPITSVKLRLEMGQRLFLKTVDGTSDHPVVKTFRDADHQLDRLARLLDNLLDVSRSQMGNLQLHVEEFDLADLIREVSDRFVDNFAHAKSTLTLELGSDLQGTWDRDRLDQVLTNLVTNALRYAPRSLITVRAHRQGNRVLLSVKDNGPGISVEHQQKLFHRYQRGAFGSALRGMGLGLYISREIIQAHQGTIWVESEAGRGAEFCISLPLVSLVLV